MPPVARTRTVGGSRHDGAPAPSSPATPRAAGGAVIIEDQLSRVLAYSRRQRGADPARVATIVERQAPDGSTATGSWSVNGQDICTTFPGEEQACVTVSDTPPAPGASGEVEGEGGVTTWAVSEGKAF